MLTFREACLGYPVTNTFWVTRGKYGRLRVEVGLHRAIIKQSDG